MKTYHEKRQEAEDFITNRINQHLESIESTFDGIGLEETLEEYSNKLENVEFGTETNDKMEELVYAVVDGQIILSVKIEKNYLDEFTIYENNL